MRARLAVLAASRPAGRIAEIGTAFGEGALAIAATMPADGSLVTVEPDRERYEVASRALAGTRAEVLHGTWEVELPPRGPFDLIFFDGGTRGDTLGLAMSLLAPGGMLVKDDLEPGAPAEGDPVRGAFLRDPRLVATEILTMPTAAAIIAVRRPV